MAQPISHHRESPSLTDYWRIVRRRLWIVVACVVLVPLTAYFLSARQPAQYQASSEVYLSTEDIAATLTGLSAQYVDESRMTDTQAKLAHVPNVAQKAVELSGVQGITADGLLGSSAIIPDSTTNILTFLVTNHNPEAAAKLATAYARAFKLFRGAMDSQTVRSARKSYEQRLASLQESGQGSSSLAKSIRQKADQLELLAALQTGRTYVVRTAQGAAKIAPTPRKNASLGLALGLVLGLGLAFLIEVFDTRVRSADEVGRRLGLTLLARITPPPRGMAKEDKLVMIAQPTSPDAEVFRMLRTNLDFAMLGGAGPRMILVTSAVEQEGKSTTVANLAVAEARAGRRVALVDLDLRLPYIDRFFGLQHAEGITDVALGHTTLEAALHRIDLDSGFPLSPAEIRRASGINGTPAEQGTLHVLVSGPRPPDPGEFVGTQRLADILDQLRPDFDLVFVDTPPALRVGDAMALSTRVDAVLVVTKLSLIRRPMLAELRRLLEKSPMQKLGYVVTGARTRQAGDYGYSYGYGYGYGYNPPAPATAQAPVPQPATNGSVRRVLPAPPEPDPAPEKSGS